MADGRKLIEYIFLLWFFGTIPGHGYTLRGFAVTLCRYTTLGRPFLDEWSARCRNLYLTRHNIKKRWVSLTPAGFELKTPPSERPQTPTLDRATIGIGSVILVILFVTKMSSVTLINSICLWIWLGSVNYSYIFVLLTSNIRWSSRLCVAWVTRVED